MGVLQTICALSTRQSTRYCKANIVVARTISLLDGWKHFCYSYRLQVDCIHSDGSLADMFRAVIMIQNSNEIHIPARRALLLPLPKGGGVNSSDWRRVHK